LTQQTEGNQKRETQKDRIKRGKETSQEKKAQGERSDPTTINGQSSVIWRHNRARGALEDSGNKTPSTNFEPPWGKVEFVNLSFEKTSIALLLLWRMNY